MRNKTNPPNDHRYPLDDIYTTQACISTDRGHSLRLTFDAVGLNDLYTRHGLGREGAQGTLWRSPSGDQVELRIDGAESLRLREVYLQRGAVTVHRVVRQTPTGGAYAVWARAIDNNVTTPEMQVRIYAPHHALADMRSILVGSDREIVVDFARKKMVVGPSSNDRLIGDFELIV